MRRIALVVALVLAPLFFTVDRSAATGPRITTPGSRLWVARFAGRAGYDAATSVAASPDGTKVFVTGASTGTTGNDYATLAYDASTGEQLWKTRYEVDTRRGASVAGMAVSPDASKVFVTGSIFVRSGLYLWATVAYDAKTGAQVWVRRYGRDSGSSGSPRALAVSLDGMVLFVTGTRRDPDGSTASATIAYVAVTGLEVWVKGYDGPGVDGKVGAAALAVAPDGGTLFVTGSSEGRSYHYVTLAYDASTGSRLWLTRHRSTDDEDAVSIAVSPDGTMVFVTGDNLRSVDFFRWTSSATIAYGAATGAEIWEKSSADDRRAPGWVSSVAVSPDGEAVFVTGTREGPPSSEIDDFTVALDASSGATLWGRRYGAGPYLDDYAYAMAVSPDGSEVFITGESGRRRNYDYATVAYDASRGTELWVRRYEGLGDKRDAARSVAVSPDGSKVFVTGESTESTGFDSDFATIAYAA